MTKAYVPLKRDTAQEGQCQGSFQGHGSRIRCQQIEVARYIEEDFMSNGWHFSF